MANYANLKATINANIKANGAEEITGPILNNVLNAAVNALGAGWQYMGVATPATSPGTPDANVFYIASTAGTYTNFGGLAVADGEVAILKYNGSWSKEVTGAATAAQVTQLGQEVDLAINGGERVTTITPANSRSVCRIAGNTGKITDSSSDSYSMVAFLLEMGKTYLLSIPKLTSAYTIAYAFDNGDSLQAGVQTVPPSSPIVGPLEDYETEITAPSSELLYLKVTYETAYGIATLSTTEQVEGLVDKVENLDGKATSLEDSVEDLSGDMATLSGKIETIEDDVADLDSAVNGGTELITIVSSNSVANRRIAINTGNLTSSNATAYSVCAFPIEYGKTYHLIIPKLTSAYTYAYTFSNVDTLVAGETTLLPSSPVVGPLNNYGIDISAPNANMTFLLVCYETDDGVPTLTTETATDGLVGDVANLKESVDALQKGGKITIKKVSNTEIDLYIPNKENTAYLIHPIIRNGYTLDLSAEGGSPAMVCGDLYDPGDIVDAGNNAIVQGNLNFIFMVDADASGSGYENEGSYHVGSGGGHGLEVMDYALFFADGKQFSISEMTEDIVCSEFRFVQKSKCYAVDNTHNTGNAHNYPKLVNGEPIVTAEHYLDAVYKPGNIIKWRNQLNIKRDHIVFKQLHAGMLRPYSTHLSKMVVSDNKMSRCEWGMIGGVWTVTYIPESNSLLPNTIKADEVFVSGDSTISAYQRMFQDNGARYEKSQMMFAEYASTNSLKSYFMPAIVSRGSTSPETFNSGDILSVTNIREINI